MFPLFFSSHEKSATATEKNSFPGREKFVFQTPTKSFGIGLAATETCILGIFLTFFRFFSEPVWHDGECNGYITARAAKDTVCSFKRDFFSYTRVKCLAFGPSAAIAFHLHKSDRPLPPFFFPLFLARNLRKDGEYSGFRRRVQYFTSAVSCILLFLEEVTTFFSSWNAVSSYKQFCYYSLNAL